MKLSKIVSVAALAGAALTLGTAPASARPDWHHDHHHNVRCHTQWHHGHRVRVCHRW